MLVILSIIGYEFGVLLITIGLTLLFIPKYEFEQLQQYERTRKILGVGIKVDYFIELLIDKYFSKYAGIIFVLIHIITLVTYLEYKS